MKTETKEVFITDDGREFTNRAEAEKHEKAEAAASAHRTYWHIAHNPDLTEGRGMYGSTYVKCEGVAPYNAEMLMQDYCFRTFGSPAAFVQGCALTPNWKLRQIDRDAFLQPRDARVGDYSHKAKTITLRPTLKSGLLEEDPAP